MPIERYGVGKPLPPHLSPWVDNEEEGYKPAYAEVIEKLKNGEAIDEIDKEEDDSVAVDAKEESDIETANEAEDDDDDSESEEEEEEKKGDKKKKKARAKKRREAAPDFPSRRAPVARTARTPRCTARPQKSRQQSDAPRTRRRRQTCSPPAPAAR